MTQRSAGLQTLPFVVLCGILTDRSAAMLSAPWDREQTAALARATAALFTPQRRQATITVATLGWAYPATQLTPPNPLSFLFAWHAANLVRRARRASGGPLPAHAPVVPHAHLPFAPPAVEAEEQHTSSSPLWLHVVGVPCAIIGPSRALVPLIPALTPLPVVHPAVTALRDLLCLRFAAPAEVVWPVAPTAVHAVKPHIQRMQHDVRRWLAVQYARDHAPTIGGPVVAAQARYGTPGKIQLLSLVIQRADTLEAVKTHLFTMDDFPHGLSEAQPFMEHLCFAWGVRLCHTHAAVLPVRWDPHGQLQVFRLCAEHTPRFPADTLFDRAH